MTNTEKMYCYIYIMILLIPLETNKYFELICCTLSINVDRISKFLNGRKLLLGISSVKGRLTIFNLNKRFFRFIF